MYYVVRGSLVLNNNGWRCPSSCGMWDGFHNGVFLTGIIAILIIGRDVRRRSQGTGTCCARVISLTKARNRRTWPWIAKKRIVAPDSVAFWPSYSAYQIRRWSRRNPLWKSSYGVLYFVCRAGLSTAPGLLGVQYKLFLLEYSFLLLDKSSPVCSLFGFCRWHLIKRLAIYRFELKWETPCNSQAKLRPHLLVYIQFLHSS